MEYLCRYIPTVSPTEYIVCVERCNGVVTCSFFRRFYRRNDRGIQTEIVIQWCGTVTNGITDGINLSVMVIPSEKKPLYTHPICRHSLPLFLLLLLSHPTSPLPNCSQPPIPTLHYSQQKRSSFFISCTWSQYPFLVDFIIFFVSKSILFSFNI